MRDDIGGNAIRLDHCSCDTRGPAARPLTHDGGCVQSGKTVQLDANAILNIRGLSDSWGFIALTISVPCAPVTHPFALRSAKQANLLSLPESAHRPILTAATVTPTLLTLRTQWRA